MQQVSQPPKSMFLYSIGSSFSTLRLGSRKWRTNIIVLSFDSVYIKKSYRDGQKFLLHNSLVKLLVYRKQIWWWKVAYTCSFLRKQYYLNINCVINYKEEISKWNNQFFIKQMNVFFFILTLKKIANLICIFCNFLVCQLYCNQRGRI